MTQSSANGGVLTLLVVGAVASFQLRFSFLVEPGRNFNGLSGCRSSLSFTVSSAKKRRFPSIPGFFPSKLFSFVFQAFL